ncbi:MAG: hypothetical protein RR942_18560 [Romboutsia sp.]
MKKYILILCIGVCVVLSIVGCSNINSNKSDVDKVTESEKHNDNIRDFYENPVLVDNEDLKISAVSLQYMNDYGMIELTIENKSDELISISLDKLFFTSEEREARLSCNINPKSSVNEYIYIESVNAIEDFNNKIEGTFDVLINKNSNQYKFFFKG